MRTAIKARIPGFKLFKNVSVEPLDFRAEDVFLLPLRGRKRARHRNGKNPFYGTEKASRD